MQTVPLQLSDVIYNAATQSFEALVTVHDHRGTRSYTCAIGAPISMSFEEAANGLATQALRRHNRGAADSVKVSAPAALPHRANRVFEELRRLTLDHFATGRAHAA